jgi:hypothetical protein
MARATAPTAMVPVRHQEAPRRTRHHAPETIPGHSSAKQRTRPDAAMARATAPTAMVPVRHQGREDGPTAESPRRHDWSHLRFSARRRASPNATTPPARRAGERRRWRGAAEHADAVPVLQADLRRAVRGKGQHAGRKRCVFTRDSGQTTTKAPPMTRLSGIAPPRGSPMWPRRGRGGLCRPGDGRRAHTPCPRDILSAHRPTTPPDHTARPHRPTTPPDHTARPHRPTTPPDHTARPRDTLSARRRRCATLGPRDVAARCRGCATWRRDTRSARRGCAMPWLRRRRGSARHVAASVAKALTGGRLDAAARPGSPGGPSSDDGRTRSRGDRRTAVGDRSRQAAPNPARTAPQPRITRRTEARYSKSDNMGRACHKVT